MKRKSVPISDLVRSRDEHLNKAREYEKGGNAQGAAQLRAVANLLQALIDGHKPATVLP